jgi:glycosyltransferase involved in cell wall biosynthesis
MSTNFTIIIPTLNEEKNLPNLLSDLQNQSYKNFNIVVVDANSKDKTQKIAKKYKANLIVSNKKNVSYQRNLGAKEAKTEWLVFMDADNRIPKNYLISLKRHAMELDPDILSTWFKPDTNLRQDRFTATLMNIFIDLNKNTPTPYVMESMILFKKKSFEKLGGFDTTIGWREGEELLKRARKLDMKFEFVKTPRYKYSFRRFKKSGSPKLFQSMVKMEILRITKGKLPEDKAKKYYPMKGGRYYDATNKKLVSSLEKSFDSWKSFFR